MDGYVHGGDIYRNEVNMDCSVSINPVEWPKELRERISAISADLSNVQTYPDLAYAGLKGTIARYTGEPVERIVCGNGASEIISAICQLARPRKVILPVPCYSGYARAAKAAGVEVVYVPTAKVDVENSKAADADVEYVPTEGVARETKLLDFDNTGLLLEYIEQQEPSAYSAGSDIVILGNPSNPTGIRIPPDIYEKLVRLCEAKGILLLVDECFIELSMTAGEYRSSYAKIRGRTLVRLRAFTKSFRLAGLRLGYALCEDEAFARRLNGILPEWNVSTPAMKIGEACLAYECSKPTEGGYLAASLNYIAQERRRVSDELIDAGIKVYESTANYMLLYSETDLYAKLLQKKILIRDCANIAGLKKGYYRISLRDRTDDDRLIAEIRSAYMEK